MSIFDDIRKDREYIASLDHSRSAYKESSKKARARCKRLRHRQRALLSALQEVLSSKSLEEAKFSASVALGGWGDDEIVSRALAAFRAACGERE